MAEKLIPIIPKYNKQGDMIGFYREVKMGGDSVETRNRKRLKKGKVILRNDCSFFATLVNNQTMIAHYCLAYRGEDAEIISCGKDCPFYEKRG